VHVQLELGGRSMKGALKQANRIGARYVAWVEGDGTAQLKEMESGEQRAVALEQVVRGVLRGPGL
jgi:histidyl-tRNA synthetase